ncbi:MAG: AraC family transcriptional regulator [Spirochaetes bacterium]|nr:AraC family transcriptional regulator [Spirochaetota bacterium]
MRNDRYLAHFNINDTHFDYLHSIADPPENVEIEMHESFELFFFLSGDITFFIEGKPYQSIQKGDILIINNHELHRMVLNSTFPYERIVIHFTPKYLAGIQPDDFDILDFVTKRKIGHLNRIEAEKIDTTQIFSIIKKMDEMINSEAEERKIMIKLLFLELLINLRRLFIDKQGFISTPKQHEKKIKDILKYINHNLKEKITLHDIETQFEINKYYLCHLFKKSTGFSVMDYIIYKRIMKAKQLLLEGYPIIDTCYEVGFGDYSNFYKIFKRLLGMTPKQYIKKH